MGYYFSVELESDFDSAIEQVAEKLKAEGFGVLMDIDVQKTLKEKIGVERKPYRIMGACNPKLANQAIEAEPDIGVLLPCNFIARETNNGKVVISFMDPAAVLGMVDNDALGSLGEQVRDALQRVCDALK